MHAFVCVFGNTHTTLCTFGEILQVSEYKGNSDSMKLLYPYMVLKNNYFAPIKKDYEKKSRDNMKCVKLHGR